jgi:undecaprenyl-diphosphatase
LDLLLLVKAVLLGLIEGLTEFLPISSTGHLIVAEDLLAANIARREVFIVAIQAGAILAVVFAYRARLLHIARAFASDERERRLVVNIAIAFVPAAIAGVLFKKAIETVLFFPVPVAAALVVGGLIILIVERAHAARDYHPRIDTIDDIGWADALKIGCAQCLALIPGTSRSGATIIGGLVFGFSRRAATEFSFFLAIPTVIGASVYSLYKARDQLVTSDLPLFAAGFVAAFVAAWIAVRGLLAYISGHDFRAFAWYRIAFGGVILATFWFGWVDWAQ